MSNGGLGGGDLEIGIQMKHDFIFIPANTDLRSEWHSTNKQLNLISDVKY